MSFQKPVLLKSEEARKLVKGPDGEPRWSRQAFRRLLDRGDVPVQRIGGRYYINRDEFLAFFGGGE